MTSRQPVAATDSAADSQPPVTTTSRRSRLPSLLSSLRLRIAAAFLGMLLLVTGAFGYLVYRYQEVSRSQQLVVDGYLPLARAVSRLDSDLERIDRDVERLMRDAPRTLVGASSPVAIYSDEIRNNLGLAAIRASAAQRMARTPREQAALRKALRQIERAVQLFEAYQTDAAELVRLAEGGEREAAERLRGPTQTQAKRLTDEIDTLERLVDERIAQLVIETERARLNATAVAGLLTAGSMIASVALLIAVLFALRPIGLLTSEVQRLGAGDYTGRIEVRGADEIAQLATEFNGMVRALQLRDRRLVERAEQLNRLSRYLTSVLNALDDGLFVVEDGHVTLANPAAVRVWGVTSGEPPPASLHAVAHEVGRHELPGPDESLQAVRTTALGDTGLVVVTADITDQTRAKEALDRSERLALIGQMLAQITHEVRNPLNALSLNAELLTDELELLDPERATEAWEVLGTISGEIERLTQVTAHYLQLARRPPAELAPERLDAVLRDLQRFLGAELTQQGVQLTLDLADCPPQLVDGRQIRQALLNVIRNAVESGGRRLALRLRRTDKVVSLALEDDGEGMLPEALARATDPFFSTRASGTGLGLAITRQILEDHHGTVNVTSAPGQGTILTLVLPDRPAPTDPLAAEEAW